MQKEASFLLLVLAVPVSAASDIKAELAACLALQTDAIRLACYDRVLQRAQHPTPAPDTDKAPESIDAEDMEEAEDVEEASVVAPVRPANAASGAPQAEPREANVISATITQVRKLQRGQFVLTLDNGQVWRETEAKRRARFKVGQRVTIRKGRLSDRLRNEATGYSNTVHRVR